MTTIKSGYARIMLAVYKSGQDAACGHYTAPPAPPYKRADYRRMWQMGFDNMTRAIAERRARLNNVETY